MKKTSKVIEISGLTGIAMLLFSGVCLFVGFVIFPGFLAMNIWNKASSAISGFPQLNLFQGVLLWIIAALSAYISKKGKCPIALKRASQLNEEEINDLMRRIKEKSAAKKFHTMVLNKDEINKNEIFDKIKPEDNEQKKEKENL